MYVCLFYLSFMWPLPLSPLVCSLPWFVAGPLTFPSTLGVLYRPWRAWYYQPNSPLLLFKLHISPLQTCSSASSHISSTHTHTHSLSLFGMSHQAFLLLSALPGSKSHDRCACNFSEMLFPEVEMRKISRPCEKQIKKKQNKTSSSRVLQVSDGSQSFYFLI